MSNNIEETMVSELADERELIGRAQKGDKDAFSALVGKYEKYIFNIGLRVLENREDAADMTQNVLLKIYNNLHRFRGDAAFSTWVYRISVNACRDALRLAYKRKEKVFSDFCDVDDDMPVYDVADHSTSPELIYTVGEESRYLYSLIARLEPPFRIIILLRELSGLGYQEIADVMQLPLGTVKSRLNRARAAIREQISYDAKQNKDVLRLIRRGGDQDGMC